MFNINFILTMAKLPKFPLGKFSGKLGNKVYYEYRGQLCIRSKPKFTKPPSSPGQLAQQERIAAVALFYQALKEVGIYGYWKKAAEGLLQTGYNLLVQANLPAFDGEGKICDFSKVNLTPGGIPWPDNFTLQRGEVGEWVAVWNTAVRHPKAKADDRLVIALMKDAVTYDVKLPEIGTPRREDGKAVFHISEELSDFVYLFWYFCSDSDQLCSKSLFNIKINYYGHV